MISLKEMRPVKYLLVPVFIVIFAASLFLVYGVYEDNLSAEIYSYARELERQIRDTAVEEYRQLYLATQAGHGVLSEADDEKKKERVEALEFFYGPEGQLPDIFLTVGLARIEQPEQQLFYDLRTGEWTETDYRLDKRELGYSLLVSEEGVDRKDRNFFIKVKEKGSDTVLLFQIDKSGFINIYLEPAVTSAFPGWRIEWIKTEQEPLVPGEWPDFGFRRTEYSFRPLRIITGLDNNKTPLVIPVPGFRDSRNLADGRRSDFPDFKADEGGFENEPEPDLPFLSEPERLISIRSSQGSFYYELERKAAINYFESVLLLTVIVASFLILLFQFDKLRQLRKKEREFVASITHELRTPLTVIQAAADNLSTGIVPAEKLKIYGSMIIEQSGRLGKMIEEILMFSKMEDKKSRPPEPVLIDFSSLIPELQSTLDTIAETSGGSLHWDVNSLPRTAAGDLQAFKLITENLVSNAVYHAYGTDAGTVRVRMKYSIIGSLQVIVEDDGRGIEAREARRIFEPFYRDNISRQRQEKGSGLGLFIAKRKAELAGGSLRLESPYQRIDGRKADGCRFTLILPCSTAAEVDNG